jgi:hypothetical protein
MDYDELKRIAILHSRNYADLRLRLSTKRPNSTSGLARHNEFEARFVGSMVADSDARSFPGLAFTWSFFGGMKIKCVLECDRKPRHRSTCGPETGHNYIILQSQMQPLCAIILVPSFQHQCLRVCACMFTRSAEDTTAQVMSMHLPASLTLCLASAARALTACARVRACGSRRRCAQPPRPR